MSRRNLYLFLCVLGVLVPYLHFFPWLQEHGLNLELFLHDFHSNHVSEFFSADVMVSALVVLVLLFTERRVFGAKVWLPVIGLFTVGVSLALPLLLYLREVSSPVTKAGRPA